MAENTDRRHITVSEMAPHVHSFSVGENKVNKIANWLINWIKKSLEDGNIKPYDFLPQKGDLAFHIGVSIGTMQNVFRIVEDNGYIESKQRIGSYIKDTNIVSSEKLTSKREVAVEAIKQYIADNNLKTGDTLISIRKLSKVLAIPFATLRASFNFLVADEILEKKANNYIIKSIDFTVKNREQKTLVEKIAERINLHIKNHLKAGNKLPSNNTLADMYNVSLKTIHDAIKILSLAGIVKTRRGYYGTIVCSNNNKENQYFYLQVEQCIKKYIVENCKIGSKLPTIKTFAEVLNVSAKTVKNALDNLADDGYINFTRGRYGGTFVIELPVSYESGYTWLALSPEFEQKQ